VTAMSCASSSSLKEKEIQKKSRKIDKRKRKMLVSKCSITQMRAIRTYAGGTKATTNN